MGAGISQKAQDAIRAAEKDHSDELFLKECELKVLPKPLIKKFKGLKKLVLSRNFILVLPPQVGSFQLLETLKIDANELAQLPPEILQLSTLKSLNVASNQLTELPAPLSSLASLTKLNISSNRIPDLPADFPKLNKLVSIKYATSNLSQWPAAIFESKQLTHVNLHGTFHFSPVHFLFASIRSHVFRRWIRHYGHALLPKSHILTFDSPSPLSKATSSLQSQILSVYC